MGKEEENKPVIWTTRSSTSSPRWARLIPEFYNLMGSKCQVGHLNIPAREICPDCAKIEHDEHNTKKQT